MVRSRIGLIVLVAVTSAFAWALPAVAQQSTAKATTVTVTAGKPTEFGFKLSKLKVPKGVVIFKVTNTGGIPHDFKIAGKKTKVLTPGQSQTLRVTFARAGKFPFLCTVTGHAIAGMKGVLRVI